MKKFFFIALAVAFAAGGLPMEGQAGYRTQQCDSIGQYVPPKGVYRLCRRKINKRREVRYHCLDCGRKIPYEVIVVTYKERYSNGTIRIWDCLLTGSEIAISGK